MDGTCKGVLLPCFVIATLPTVARNDIATSPFSCSPELYLQSSKNIINCNDNKEILKHQEILYNLLYDFKLYRKFTYFLLTVYTFFYNLRWYNSKISRFSYFKLRR